LGESVLEALTDLFEGAFNDFNILMMSGLGVKLLNFYKKVEI
jgi:hypothetical protein